MPCLIEGHSSLLMLPGVFANNFSYQGTVRLAVSFKASHVECSKSHLCVKSACFFMIGKLLG